jgi:LacI family transcriptional regulator
MNSKKNHPKFATIKDVAKMANVSIYTVSRVVNNQGGVSETAETKVKEAIAALEYRPNIIARALKGRATKSLGLIIPSIENPVFPPLVKVIENTANKYGFTTILCISDGILEKEKQHLELLIEKQVDGIIFNAMGGYHKGFEIVNRTHTPIIVIGRKIEGFETSNVSVNNFHGGYLACEYLIKTGMKNIAILLGQLEASSAMEDRFEGYKAALKNYHIEYNENLVVKGRWSFEEGILATEELLSRNVAFDSVFASNDTIAIGCMEKLISAGYAIPDKISVIGYDDVPIASIIRPHLSTVRHPKLQFGAEAVKTILRLIHTAEDKKQEFLFEPELVIRDSTKPLL